MPENDIYLGDGVYFSPDPYQVEIYTTDGITTRSSIYLDVHVAEALVMQLKKWLEAQ